MALRAPKGPRIKLKRKNKIEKMSENYLERSVDEFVNNCVKSVTAFGPNELVARSKQIKVLFAVANKLNMAYASLLNFAEAEQAQMLEVIKKFETNLTELKSTVLGQADDTPKKSWLTVVAPKPTEVLSIAAQTEPDAKKEIKMKKREVADGVFIDSYTITKPEQCHNFKGYWCYCPEHNRFYLSINGAILEAITTNILSAEIAPYKCIEHRNITLYGNADGIDYTRSKFYIPRQFDPTSKDVRQFTARMKFVPASKELRENELYTYRIGSRDTLYQDIQHIKPEDTRLFSDLVGNYLLTYSALLGASRPP